jgi:hypothetical protein
MKKFLAVGLALTLFSCGEESPKDDNAPASTPSSTVISGTFDDGTEDEFFITNVRNYITGESDTLARTTVENGSFELNFDCAGPMFGVLMGGGTSQVIYFIPGDTLNFTITGDEEDREITIAGLAASPNNYLKAKVDLSYELDGKHTRGFSDIDSAHCIAFFDSLHQACTALLDTYVAATEDTNRGSLISFPKKRGTSTWRWLRAKFDTRAFTTSQSQST